MIQMLREQANKLREAARCLDFVAIKLDIFNDKENPIVERQKQIVRNQMKQKAEQYKKLIDEVIRDTVETPHIAINKREDMVTTAEDHNWDFHDQEGV